MPEPEAVYTKSVARRLQIVQPWEQMPGENDLWFSRFLRYLALGPTRSVSLVAAGRRNAYPVPAHWPIQAKQQNWRERSAAFDEAYKVNEATLVSWFNGALVSVREKLTPNEAAKTMGIAYQPPPPDEDYDDEPLTGSAT